MKILTEIGPDLSRFANVKHFCSWLGLCPGTKISGGKVLSAKTKRSANRVRQALKMAAMSLSHSDSALGAFYRRLCSRMDKPRANTATAHKLARMVYFMLTRGEAFVDQGQQHYEEQQHQRSIARSERAPRRRPSGLNPIARLLLDEIDEGTVTFMANYDGTTEEPKLLPARLPFVLLNGASGIAVGLATEVPSHNLREVADAAIALLRNDKLTDDELYAAIPGPDFPGGGQIISPAAEIREAYATGRGSLKVRARWKIEDLARGQWQLVITELPPGASTQKVLQEVEELVNPKVKLGKKTLTAEQLQLKATVQAVLDADRDESNREAHVRLVFEPKTPNRRAAGTHHHVLLAHTSLESSASINLTMIGGDGRPTLKSLRQILAEWIVLSPAHRQAAHRAPPVQRAGRASTSSRDGSWCCSTSTR
jgi:hypothetical protein